MNVEDSMTIEELRREVRRLWDTQHAFDDALRNLPEYPSTEALRVLKEAALGSVHSDLSEVGNALKRKWYDEHKPGPEESFAAWYHSCPIPSKTEYEIAAGMWVVIRAALLEKTKQGNQS